MSDTRTPEVPAESDADGRGSVDMVSYAEQDKVLTEPMPLELAATFNLSVDAAAFYAARIKALAKEVHVFDRDEKNRPTTFVIGDAEVGSLEVRLKADGDEAPAWRISPFSESLRSLGEKRLKVEADAPFKMVVQDAARRLAIIEADRFDQTDAIKKALDSGKLDKYLEVTSGTLTHGIKTVDILAGEVVETEEPEQSVEETELDAEVEALRKSDLKPKRPMTLEASFSLTAVNIEKLYKREIDGIVDTSVVYDEDEHGNPETIVIGNKDLGAFEVRLEDGGSQWAVSPFSTSLREEHQPYFTFDSDMDHETVVREAAKRLLTIWAGEVHQENFINRAMRTSNLRKALHMDTGTIRHGQKVVNIVDGAEDESHHEHGGDAPGAPSQG